MNHTLHDREMKSYVSTILDGRSRVEKMIKVCWFGCHFGDVAEACPVDGVDSRS